MQVSMEHVTSTYIVFLWKRSYNDTYDDTYISSYYLIKDSMSLVAVKSLDKTTLALYPCELCQGMMFIGIRAVGTSAGGNYPDWIL